MIRVRDLITRKEFAGFRQAGAADGKQEKTAGLDNIVTGTGIFEWENAEEIAQSFKPGEFVFTTLSMYRENRDKAFAGLTPLLSSQVSAIAIKDVYFDHCPEDFLTLADEHSIPVFFFSETYMDDLIYLIKDQLNTETRNSDNFLLLSEIMDAPGEDIPRLTTLLNPYFKEYISCFCAYSHNARREFLAKPPLSQEHLLTAAPHGYVLLCSSSEADSEIGSRLCQEIFGEGDFSIGFGQTRPVEEIRQALVEASTAALSAAIDQSPWRAYKELGADRFILTNMKNPYLSSFADEATARLTDHDSTHSARLLETVVCYMKNDGNIRRTAEDLYQHENTVRYRISKATQLVAGLGARDAETELYILSRICRARELLK